MMIAAFVTLGCAAGLLHALALARMVRAVAGRGRAWAQVASTLGRFVMIAAVLALAARAGATTLCATACALLVTRALALPRLAARI